MTDQTLTCRDCGTAFVFTVGEQEFFAQQGFTNVPSRCPSCRAARKQNRESGYGSSSYAGGSYGRSGGYERRERQMYPAVCAQCGKDTQVPFQPRGDRPVYCSECFETQRGAVGAGGRSHRGGW